MLQIKNRSEATKVLSQALGIQSLTKDLSTHLHYFAVKSISDYLQILAYIYAMSKLDSTDYHGLKKQIDQHIRVLSKDTDDKRSPLLGLNEMRSQLPTPLPQRERIAEDSKTPSTVSASTSEASPSKLSSRLMFGLGHKFADLNISILGEAGDEDRRIFLGPLLTVSNAARLMTEFFQYAIKHGKDNVSNSQYAIVSTLKSWELNGQRPLMRLKSMEANVLFNLLDINHYHVPFADHSVEFHQRDNHAQSPSYDAREVKLLCKLMSDLGELYNKGGCVYFHCKAGQGRSSFLAILFMSLFYSKWQIRDDNNELDIDKTIENVHAHVEENRHVVDAINPYRKAGLKQLMNAYFDYKRNETTTELNNKDSDSADNGLIEKKTKRKHRNKPSQHQSAVKQHSLYASCRADDLTDAASASLDDDSQSAEQTASARSQLQKNH